MIATPTPAALCFALAAVSAFLANEPLLVLLGHRGPRAKATDGPRASTRLAILGCAAAVIGSAGLSLADPTTRIVAMSATALPIVLVILAYRRAQHSLAGEVLAAFALPALAVPVATASSVGVADAVMVAAAWALGYGASVVAVHRVIARNKASPSRVDRLIAIGGIVILGAAAGLAAAVPVALVAVPLLAVSALLVLRLPPAKHLRAIGFALVAASGVSIAIVPAVM